MEANGFPYTGRLMGGRVLRWSALGAALALLAAGCGGKSAAEQKREFLEKANSTCKHFEDLQNQVLVPSVNPVGKQATHTQRAQWGLGIQQLAYLGQQEVKGLSKLKPPKELEDRFQALLATKGSAFAAMTRGADAAKRNHVSEIGPPIRLSREQLAKATKQAKALGLKECE
jgi:hypothetical protein